MDNQAKAERMFDLIGRAPMSDSLRGRFREMTEGGDVRGIYRLYKMCLESPKGRSVGRNLEKRGKPSFESVQAEVERIYRDP